jgi:hypothetical protein
MGFWITTHSIPRIGARLRILMCCILLGMSEAVCAQSEGLLPDFEREARKVFQGLCDEGTVSYSTFYKQEHYILEVAHIIPRGFFYFMKRFRGQPEGWEERYFRRLSDSAQLHELAHEKWDEDVKQASVNYFNKLHDLPTTCTKLLVS